MYSTDISLSQTLELSLNSNSQTNHYAYALAKSRNQAPSPQSICLTMQLIQRNRLRWLEVLERQALKDYQLVYEMCHAMPAALPVLVSTANYKYDKDKLTYLTVSILDQLQKGCHEAWYSLVILLRNHLQNDSKQMFTPLLQILTQKLSSQPSHLGQSLSQYSNLLLSNQSQPFQLQYFTTPFEVYKILILLFQRCKKMSLLSLTYLSFLREYQPMLLVIKHGVGKSFDYLRYYQTGVDRAQRRELIGDKMAVHAAEMIAEAVALTEMQELFINQRQQITHLLFGFTLLNQKTQDVSDQLNYEYSIINLEKGDDFWTSLAWTIVRVADKVPAILKTMIERIKTVLEGQKNELIMSQHLLKLSLLHALVISREDLSVNYVNPLISTLFGPQMTSIELSLGTNCRKLRLLLFFSQILQAEHFQYLVTSCLQLLNSSPSSSFAFSEADNILSTICESHSGKHTKKLVRNNSFFIVNAFVELIKDIFQEEGQDRDMKIQRMAILMRKFMENNLNEVRSEGTKITGFSSIWLYEQIQRCWARQMKSSPLIFDLVELLKCSIKLIDEHYYLDVTEHLNKVLNLLKQPQNISIVEELLSVLAVTILTEQQISPPICEILISLQVIVSNDNGNLSSIIDILRALNEKPIASNILFQWSDLIRFVLRLYLNYYRTVDESYRSLYNSSYIDISTAFQTFLQVYQDYISENSDVVKEIMNNLREMPRTEEVFRVFLIVHHYANIDGCNFYGIAQAAQCKKRSTIKLTFLYFMDKLLRNYNENTLKQMVDFSKIFQEKKARRALEAQIVSQVPYPEVNAKIYVTQGLKTLKGNKVIDLMDYTILLKEMNLD